MKGYESGEMPLLEGMAVLAEPVRARLLAVLERQELTVSEVCAVLQLPQSTASRHLKALVDGGWVAARREGTSRHYAALPARWPVAGRQLWALVRDQMAGTPAEEEDRRRLEGVLARRRSRSQEFFSGAAGRWSELRRELFGRGFELQALPGLLDPGWVLGDLGCGTGQTSETRAPFVRRVIAVDDSEAMLAAARRRFAAAHGGAGKGAANVELRQGRLETLPVADGELDAALLVLVLHHLPDPGRALREAGRALRPGGRLLVVDMLPHSRQEYRQQMGHLWLGFAADQLTDWLRTAGFGGTRFHPLPTDPDAKGPGLFVAGAQRAAADHVTLDAREALAAAR